MAKVEVEEGDLQTFQRAYVLLNKLYGDADAGMPIKRAIKRLVPDATIPEIDIAEPLLAPVNEKLTAAEKRSQDLADRIDKMEQERKDRDDTDALRATAETVQKQYRLTDEGMQKVFSRMKEKNNPDIEAAAAYVISQQPKTAPTGSSGLLPSSMNLFGAGEEDSDEKVKLLHKDPLKFFDREVGDILNEFANGQGEAA